MIMANLPANPDKSGIICPQGVASLTSYMTIEGLNNRSGTFSIVSHMAASRGHWNIIKKVLYRLDNLGGKKAVLAHLSMENAAVSRLM